MDSVAVNGSVRRKWLGVAVMVGLAVVAVCYELRGVEAKEHFIEKVPPLLAVLFTVALIMERSIEVFLSAFRSGDADMLDLEIREADRKGDVNLFYSAFTSRHAA